MFLPLCLVAVKEFLGPSSQLFTSGGNKRQNPFVWFLWSSSLQNGPLQFENRRDRTCVLRTNWLDRYLLFLRRGIGHQVPKELRKVLLSTCGSCQHFSPCPPSLNLSSPGAGFLSPASLFYMKSAIWLWALLAPGSSFGFIVSCPPCAVFAASLFSSSLDHPHAYGLIHSADLVEPGSFQMILAVFFFISTIKPP